jgi:glycosyltransferase involved in cell wall biosynthesis
VSSAVSIVVPARDEGLIVGESLKRLKTATDEAGILTEVIVVLDGPDQVALDAIESLNDQRIKVLQLSEPQGKGAALRLGCQEAGSEFTAFFDADLDIDPTSLVTCIETLKAESRSVVCAYGSKLHCQSVIFYPVLRRIASRIFHFLVAMLFGIRCEDTQTGVKVFRTKDLRAVLGASYETRFLFDLEVLVLLGARGAKFVDCPIVITYQYSSSINIGSALKMLTDLARLKTRIRTRSKVLEVIK